MNKRLHALCDLAVSAVREYVGLHDDYDGRVQDLSLEGVRAGLARLGGPPLEDPLDDAYVTAHEHAMRVELGELELHRRNPLYHIGGLDLSCYDRDYAPAEQRAEARRGHLAAWPGAIDAAVGALDRVSAPVAQALLPVVRGLAADLDPADPLAEKALAAHARLVEHVEACARDGDPDASLGAANLDLLLSASEATEVDLGRLEEQADTAEAIAFTRERGLVPGLDGECLVGPAPPSRRWALAMMSWAAPYEADAPSRYYITPPDPLWPHDEQEHWLEVFSRSSLPAITVHEVAPGHFAHGRYLRRVAGDVRRTLHSTAFIEGWAHYVEEVCLDEGFRDGDPRFAVGVAVESLQRVTRLAVSIGLHSGSMSVDDAIARFQSDSFIRGSAARAEATRATFDPTYGRYTWGKLEILRLRERARAAWGSGYSHPRFHTALLEMGSPPLGLLGHALNGGGPM